MSFERQDHLVHGRRGDSEVLLHFGLRRWAPVDFAVVVDERQVLALLFGIGFFHRWLRYRDACRVLHDNLNLTFLGCGFECGRYACGGVPRQQLLDASNGVLGDARKDLAQVRFGIEAIEFR